MMFSDLDERDNEYRVYESELQLRQLRLTKKDELYRAMNSTADRFIKWSLAKDHFIMDVMRFMRETDRKVNDGELTPEQGIQVYQQEIDSLRRQEQALLSRQHEQFIIIHHTELNKISSSQDSRKKLIIAGVGFISGGLQMVAGMATIETGVGALFMAHGFNSVIENGYYILYREDFVGPVRFFYRGVAELFGVDYKKADDFYAVLDIGLSINSMLGTRLSSDAERLYRYIDADLLTGLKQNGVKLMTKGELIVEVGGDVNTVYGAYKTTSGDL